MKQNPFSFYDFLGYMIPGAVLLYLMNFVFKMDSLVSVLNLKDSTDANQLLSFIPAVICSYLVGHVLAIGSSAVIEAFSTYSNGYPSEFLFEVKAKPYFHQSCNKGYKNLGRLLLFIIILPISVLKLIMKDILKIKMFMQAKSLPEKLKSETFKKCKDILRDEIGVNVDEMVIDKGIDGDYLRLLYHFVFENSERHANKLQNYVALYGLTRNVSFVFLLAFWFSVYSHFNVSDSNIKIEHIITFGVFAYIFYIGFVKFYRRYSLEAIMAVSVYKKNAS
ncbi:hypothetical protein F9817_13170 [Vibrio sp. CAIM 722]|uniref:Uncharacterized protein n=1 Tax=Vibrio eleionomae TaxID=2653505 RepID=A0A7X4LLK4_9VIBR|nr:hypothetical protein [Vibrio eleionomae]MZI94144.1 hypothetical protein [Vibrio eleionomae]